MTVAQPCAVTPVPHPTLHERSCAVVHPLLCCTAKQNSICWRHCTHRTDSCTTQSSWATVSFVEASGLAERKPGPIELEGSKKGGDSSEREHVLEWAEASAKMRLDVSLSAEPLSAQLLC